MRSVVLYTRRGCHLCDEARSAILSVRAREPFAYDEVDIDTDDDLVRDYGIRIPVVTVDGEERFEIAVDEQELEGLVRIR
ncbi:MAG TPA: glutaredoxin family protein [Actinomycetota bacterium]|jgi:glutaredoxin|nr:glutaredoxin family protein [Actinomycetota bacterium]